MVGMTPKTKRNPARLTAAVVLASCVGAGAAAFGAAPAFADAPVPQYGAVIGVQKVDGATSAPLAGATLTVCAPVSTADVDRTNGDLATQRDRYQAIADETSFEVYQEGLYELIEYYAERLAHYEATLLDDATLQNWNDLLAAHYDATIAAQPYNDAIASANTERQRLADEILVLQEAGEPVPVELATEHAAAQQAQTDAIAAAQPYNDAVQVAHDTALGATEAISSHNEAALNLELTRVSAEGAQTAYENAASTWDSSRHDTFTEMAERMQRMIDEQGNLSPFVVDDMNCFTMTTGADGTIFVPISTEGGYYTVTEVVAPEGYKLFEGTVTVTIERGGSYEDGKFTHSYSQSSDDGTLTPGDDVTLGGTGETGGVALDATFSNEKISEEPPTPVEPPVEPEVPVTPEEPKPETLATTGSDAPIALAGVAGLIAAAGGALTLFRRRTAAE